MGMYDTVNIVPPDKRFTCPEGHFLTEFQTKDAENALDTYYLVEDALFVLRHEYERPGHVISRQDEGLVLVTKKPLHKVTLTSNLLRIYTSCKQCIPVLVAYSRHDVSIAERYPWIEFHVPFRDGVVTDVTSITWETRAELSAKLQAEGVRVLADDDWLAKEHFELLATHARRVAHARLSQ